MRVFECEVRCPDTGDSYTSYIAEANDLEEYDEHIKDFGITDDDVHFVFTNGEISKSKGELGTDEFSYTLLNEVKEK